MTKACIVRAPIQIRGSTEAGGFKALAQGLVTFGEGDSRADTVGDIAISAMSFVTTNGVDFKTAMRDVQFALVHGSGKLENDLDPNYIPLSLRTEQTMLLDDVVSTAFLPFNPAMPVPRDIGNSPLLQRFRYRVGAAAGGFDWTIRVWLVELLTEMR